MTTKPKLNSGLIRVLSLAMTLLGLKILVSILLEYRSYFPPDFDSAFLTGREDYFSGAYSIAFYLHIIVGPFAVVLAATLLTTGIYGQKHRTTRFIHRLSGYVLWPLAIVILMPTGLVMATRAFAGPVAAFAFVLLSLCTGATAFQAVRYARKLNYSMHRHWALRCIVLLFSPLLLRMIGGVYSLMALEAPVYYQLNAWLSWLLPLLTLELIYVRHRWRRTKIAQEILSDSHTLATT